MSTTDPTQQARVSLPASENPLPAQLSETGSLPPGQIVSVSVITRRRKPLKLSELGGRILSHEEFDREYAGDPADFQALREFAHQHGLSVDEGASSLSRRTLVLRGPAAQMEKAFGVSLKTFQHVAHGKHFHGFKGTLSVPGEQADRIEAVLGLDTRPVAKSHLRWLNEQAEGGRIIRANASAASYTASARS